MHPSLSMNTGSESVDLNELERRTKLHAAQRASQPLSFHPKDGSAPLLAWAVKEVGDGWWDIIVDNIGAEDGTPHRIFETRSRMVGPLDNDTRGLFSVGAPAPRNGEVLGRLAHGASPYQREVDFEAMRARANAAAKAKEEMLRLGVPPAAPGVADIARLYNTMDGQSRAPGKMFSRETVCAVIRAERTRPQSADSLETLNRIQSIYENME